MRIGFDAKRAFMNASGLGNYARTLMKSMLQNFPEHDYFAFTPGIREELGQELVRNTKLKIILPPQLMRTFLSSWWRSSLMSEDIRSNNLDIYHGLSNELPKGIPRSTKKVVTIHDLIFIRHPEWYPFVDRNIYYSKFRYACKHADAVVAVSEQTKKDIMYYFNTGEEKIKVIYQSCSERFSEKTGREEMEKFRKGKNLPENYLLYVGTIEERKNLLTLVKAMKDIDLPLVVIGRKTGYFDQVNDFIRSGNLENKILFPANVSGDDLPLFFQGAEIFIYPSFYEGFGIPVIEALQSGVPVMASGTTALPEAGGPHSEYFDPADAGALAEKIKMLLGNRVLREQMIEQGRTYVKRFDSKVTSAQLSDLYKSLV